MILKGSQRGGAGQLAAHLLNARDNEHIEVHELRGVSADDLHAAFQEIEATSRGTRATQFLFSLSFNPPPREQVTIAEFEAAIRAINHRLVGVWRMRHRSVFCERRRTAHANHERAGPGVLGSSSECH